jgi:hypothetical protein
MCVQAWQMQEEEKMVEIVVVFVRLVYCEVLMQWKGNKLNILGYVTKE